MKSLYRKRFLRFLRFLRLVSNAREFYMICLGTNAKGHAKPNLAGSAEFSAISDVSFTKRDSVSTR
jgi:hypothetical protein